MQTHGGGSATPAADLVAVMDRIEADGNKTVGDEVEESQVMSAKEKCLACVQGGAQEEWKYEMGDTILQRGKAGWEFAVMTRCDDPQDPFAFGRCQTDTISLAKFINSPTSSNKPAWVGGKMKFCLEDQSCLPRESAHAAVKFLAEQEQHKMKQDLRFWGSLRERRFGLTFSEQEEKAKFVEKVMEKHKISGSVESDDQFWLRPFKDHLGVDHDWTNKQCPRTHKKHFKATSSTTKADCDELSD